MRRPLFFAYSYMHKVTDRERFIAWLRFRRGRPKGDPLDSEGITVTVIWSTKASPHRRGGPKGRRG